MSNPHKPPNTPPLESNSTVHKSFRLTATEDLPDTMPAQYTFRDALRFSLVQQVPLLILSALLLDGGVVFRRVGIASVAFWVCILIIAIRRGNKMTTNDFVFAKWGYLPLLLVTCVLWLTASTLTP